MGYGNIGKFIKQIKYYNMQILEDKKQIQKLSKPMAEYINKFDQQVDSFMAELNLLIFNTGLIPDYQIDVSKLIKIININDNEGSYADDGCTKVPGRGWEGYFVFPLFDNKNSDFYLGSIKGGYCGPAIIFYFDNFIQRISDGKINGVKFNTINLVLGDSIGRVMSDRNSVEKVTRIDYTNDNYKDFAIFNTCAATKLVYLLEHVVKINNIYNELHKIIKPKE